MSKRDCIHCGKEMSRLATDGCIDHQCQNLDCKYFDDTGHEYFELETKQDQEEAKADSDLHAQREEGK